VSAVYERLFTKIKPDKHKISMIWCLIKDIMMSISPIYKSFLLSSPADGKEPLYCRNQSKGKNDDIDVLCLLAVRPGLDTSRQK
jgi:hypothetical protein